MFSSRNLTVLYIEHHNDRIQNMISELMREHGLNVLTTNNTTKAHSLFRANTVDLIVINIPMPNEDGLDFIRHLRQLNIMIPVIITADDSDKEVLLKAINLDIAHYLPKPFEPAQLIDAIDMAIKKMFSYSNSTFVNLHNGFDYDLINKSVISPDGVAIQLSKKEYLLLELLLKNKRKIIPYDVIESFIWQDSTMSIDALRTLVRGIRKKTYPAIITNNNGIGYKIDL
jgi:two-component system, OmpR family, response regulator VanR